MLNKENSDKPTFWQVITSVLSALIGVQSNEARERDFTHGKLWHYVVVGLVVAFIFVLVLVLVVKLALP
jgi:uncharacterized membrane protein YidH (DUF202 family)